MRNQSMTPDEFIMYVKGIIDSENEKLELQKALTNGGKIELIGPIKLIKEALEKIITSNPQSSLFKYDYTPVSSTINHHISSPTATLLKG